MFAGLRRSIVRGRNRDGWCTGRRIAACRFRVCAPRRASRAGRCTGRLVAGLPVVHRDAETAPMRRAAPVTSATPVRAGPAVPFRVSAAAFTGRPSRSRPLHGANRWVLARRRCSEPRHPPRGGCRRSPGAIRHGLVLQDPSCAPGGAGLCRPGRAVSCFGGGVHRQAVALAAIARHEPMGAGPAALFRAPAPAARRVSPRSRSDPARPCPSGSVLAALGGKVPASRVYGRAAWRRNSLACGA